MDHQQEPERPDDPHTVDPVAMLLRATREEPDARRRVRVRASVHAAWHDTLAQQRGRRRYPLLAMAAALTFTLLAAWLLLSRSGTLQDAPILGSTVAPAVVATVTVVEGQVLNLGAAENTVARTLQAGDTVMAQDRIRTGRGRLGLRLKDGLEIDSGVDMRLDALTEMRITALDTVELVRGALYIDTNGAAVTETHTLATHALAIVTPFGTARDIGTRFSVRLDEQALHVAVRDGEVEVEQASGRHLAAGGTALVLSADGEATRTLVAPYDTTWAWAASLAPGFELDGASLAAFLAWLAHESGWTIEYGTQDLAAQANSWHLSGPRIQGMAPKDALIVAMRTNELDFELEDGTVTILGDGARRDDTDTSSEETESGIGRASG